MAKSLCVVQLGAALAAVGELGDASR